MAWWAWLLLAIALNIVAYLLMPRPKQPKPPEVKDLDDPTADAGRPVPVVFGTLTVKGVNVLWFGDKNKYTYKIDA
jgi:hypothetical protein